VASGVSFDATGHLSGTVDLAPTSDDTPSGPPDAGDAAVLAALAPALSRLTLAPGIAALALSPALLAAPSRARPVSAGAHPYWARLLPANTQSQADIYWARRLDGQRTGAGAHSRVGASTLADAVAAIVGRLDGQRTHAGVPSRPAATIGWLDGQRTDAGVGESVAAVAAAAARRGTIRPALLDETPLHASFEGFVLDASGFTLNDAGLGIAAMTVTLPLSNTDGSGPAQLTGTGIGIASSGAVSGTLGLPHYAGSLFGFPTVADNIQLGNHALRLDAITVTLPLSNTDGTAPAQLVARGSGANPAPVSIDPHGAISGTLSLPHFAGSFFGFGLAADNVRLGNHALRVDAITVTGHAHI